MSEDEQVLGITRKIFDDALGQGFHGVSRDPGPLLRVLEKGHAEFRLRKEAEEDVNFKQIIPYQVICQPGGLEVLPKGSKKLPRAKEAHLLTYCRGGKIQEQRLAKKWSLGIGGHINPEDVGSNGNGSSKLVSAVITGADRELREEVTSRRGQAPGIIGVVNEIAGIVYTPRDHVGHCHVGLVMIVEVSDNDLPITSNESANLTDMGFDTLDHILENQDRFEQWSQWVFREWFAPQAKNFLK